MADDEHVKILEEGVDVWNRWRKDNVRVRSNLIDANLSGADLRDAKLGGAYFRCARAGTCAP